MRRALAASLLLALAAVAAAGCASSDGGVTVPATVRAPPQTAQLGWKEPYPAEQPALVFGVSSFTVTRTGWTAEISVENRSDIAWEVGDPRTAAQLAFGVLLFPNDDLDELERRNRDGTLPAIRHATTLRPCPARSCSAREDVAGDDLGPGRPGRRPLGAALVRAVRQRRAIRPRAPRHRSCGSPITPTTSTR